MNNINNMSNNNNIFRKEELLGLKDEFERLFHIPKDIAIK